MSKITEIATKSITSSQFLKLKNVQFLQNGKLRSWDFVSSMDAVSALLFDKEFICVKQFRPPLYFGASELTKSIVPSETLGFCYELCAGLMDIKGRSKEQAIVDEIKEELGYEVPIDSLEFITKTIGNVGMAGARGYMYFVEVTPDQKKYPGGGLESEGEQIETVRIKEDEIDDFLADQTKEKSGAFFMALYWWRHLRNRQYICFLLTNRHQKLK